MLEYSAKSRFQHVRLHDIWLWLASRGTRSLLRISNMLSDSRLFFKTS